MKRLIEAFLLTAASVLLVLTSAPLNAQVPIYTRGPSSSTSSVLPGAFPLLAPDGGTTYSFSSSTNSGIGYPNGGNPNQIWITANGTSVVQIGSSFVQLPSAATFGWASGALGTAADTILARDAANTLALKNGNNAQIFRVYNTFTSATNLEAFSIDWTRGANRLLLSTDAGSASGGVRALDIAGATISFYPGAAGVGFGVLSNSGRWNMGTTFFGPNADNTTDIGASGANRPRNLYLASSIKQVGAVTTSGLTGVSAIVATPRVTAQTAASANLGGAYTTSAADGTFEVSGNINITASTTFSINMTVTYTDEGNTARTVTLNFTTLAGVISNAAITNTGGTGPYEGVPIHIRAKASTTITCATTGTFTTVTYNAECIIKQTA